MKIAVIGSGGREHAITWKLAQRVGTENIFTLPGNGGTPNNRPIDVNDFEGIKAFCLEEGVELIVVGPEVPLSKGIVDFFKDTDIKVFGPSREAATLEGSKLWAKEFMQKYGVATAKFHRFDGVAKAKATLLEAYPTGKVVLKYDGLAAGKGVFVCTSLEEMEAALEEMAQTYGAKCSFLAEELLEGDEISIIGVTDGTSIQLFLPSQDHKQLLEGDKGPNTGGMGVICPVPFYNETLKEEIYEAAVAPTLKGLQAEKLDYKGIIYFGLMITTDGPKVLEYNARLGDPETEVLLPSLKSDLLELILACFDGTLAEKTPEFHDGAFADVVLVSGGYPKSYQKGYTIDGLENLNNETLVFHAGTKKFGDAVVTSGGRVLNIVCHGADLDEALEKVYVECKKVTFEDVFFRKDIGKRVYKVAKNTPVL